MHIWVDADACPKAIKSILFKAADRRQIPMTLVANQYIATPPSKVIKSIQVAQGFDVADNTIVEQVTPGDLVITSDVPLAADVVAKGAEALNPRGTHYTRENIRDYLQRRNRLLDSAGCIPMQPVGFRLTHLYYFDLLIRLLTVHMTAHTLALQPSPSSEARRVNDH